MPSSSTFLRLGRAARLRCPHCGTGPLFRRWFWMFDRCSGCRLRMDRGEADYFVGSYVVNLVGAELAVVGLGFAALVATWPDVPWDGLTWGLLAVMVPLPALTYPFSKTLWLALDLSFRPATPGDFEEPG